jgi:D-alanyl-D-alanine carboxypeptidase
MSEARGDTPEHILDQENAASTLIDHALCDVPLRQEH